MKDQVSFGSQPQSRPHAASAQIAPQITAKVQIGKANACTRRVVRSRPSAGGSRYPRDHGKDRFPSPYPVRIRVIAAATKPTRKEPGAGIAAVSGVFSQYELRPARKDRAFGCN